ncbi:MAG: UDP-N-acetylmuramoyl-L-alanine--D-glutamate ligase, partial [Candidatus Omnitrophica bacterium]|nr:UDP-N-acetylmuramoyl-L-alanine--D-glutamate ligase [Candidatus Omnitrophota bacterium]
MDLKNKKVTVIGLGESGLAAVELLSRAGSIVRVTDFARSEQTKQAAAELILKGVAVELGGHTNEFIDDADLIVVSPGVPPDIPVLEQARNSNIKIISEIELGFLYCKSKIIAVTGTNGKSTVVSLLTEIFNQAGLKAVACGNISPAFCSVVNQAGADTTLIMEVSSYQLEFIEKFHP